MEQFTQEEAIKFAESKAWEDMTHRQRATFQLYQDKLCMPFSVFHESVEKALGRPVFTHEFGRNVDGLKKELAGLQGAPTLEDVINMIPREKRLLITPPGSG